MPPLLRASLVSFLLLIIGGACVSLARTDTRKRVLWRERGEASDTALALDRILDLIILLWVLALLAGLFFLKES